MRATTIPSHVQLRCAEELAATFERSTGRRLDDRLYTEAAEDNLIEGVALEAFADDLSGAAGQELRSKFRAAYSSAALAVNCFAAFRPAGRTFAIGPHDRLTLAGFERRFPTGLARAQPPHLDVVATGPTGLVAIESKCTEYLSPKVAVFSPRYAGISDERAHGTWFAEMRRLVEAQGQGYRWLDAAQLIKHALGLSHGRADRPVTLVYLWWEPLDHHASPIFAEHRAEVAAFAARVAGGSLAFLPLTYADLWDAWAARGDEELARHVTRLRARYAVRVWDADHLHLGRQSPLWTFVADGEVNR